MSNKTFFLGVGAQKSGTTWLFKYLKQYSNFYFGPMKEYHTWDYLYNPRSIRRKRIFDRIGQVSNEDKERIRLSILNRDVLSKEDKDRHRLNIINKDPPYEQYFSDLIKDKVNSTGDITPEYCMLNAEQFNVVKEKLESVGFNVKVIFLMRDPFERCLSAAKMAEKPFSLAKLYSLPDWVNRTNYKFTVNELEQVFTPDQIYYGIYEEMFTKEKIDELSAFCGVVPRYDFIEHNPNPSPPYNMTDESLKEEIINFYSEVYEFCYEKFPQTKILWNSINK